LFALAITTAGQFDEKRAPFAPNSYFDQLDGFLEKRDSFQQPGMKMMNVLSNYKNFKTKNDHFEKEPKKKSHLSYFGKLCQVVEC